VLNPYFPRSPSCLAAASNDDQRTSWFAKFSVARLRRPCGIERAEVRNQERAVGGAEERSSTPGHELQFQAGYIGARPKTASSQISLAIHGRSIHSLPGMNFYAPFHPKAIDCASSIV
jgi:hypothetical protein